ncbi:MAG: hypothetical protein ABL871_04310 [Terricaulis sp.]
MEEFNRDMGVSEDFVDAHVAIRPLLSNAKIERWFKRYDRAAVLWKKAYEFFGALSLVCIAAAALYLGYRLALAPTYGVLRELDAAGVIVGAVGLISQLVLIFAQLRDRWLLSRFAAERLRCLKFQAFRALFEPQRDPDLALAVDRHAEREVAGLRQELRAGYTAIGAFSPSATLPVWTASREGEADILQQAREVYDDLRIAMQLQHFEGRIEIARKKEQSPGALSDWVFVLASLLTLTELSLNGLHLVANFDAPEIPAFIQPWWWFVVWSLFVISAVLAIYGQARVQRVDADRYEQYRREIVEVRNQKVADWTSFASRVYAMELIALRELQDFCRDQRYFGYLF